MVSSTPSHPSHPIFEASLVASASLFHVSATQTPILPSTIFRHNYVTIAANSLRASFRCAQATAIKCWNRLRPVPCIEQVCSRNSSTKPKEPKEGCTGWACATFSSEPRPAASCCAAHGLVPVLRAHLSNWPE
jgi:hypothetical protein